MRISEAFPTKYISAADLRGREVTLRISYVTMEEIQGNYGTDNRPVCHFSNAQKGLVLNKTNANTLAGQFGDDTDLWPNREIVLYTVKTNNPQGQMVDGIRCRPVMVQTQPTNSNPIGGDPNAPINDELPPLGEPDRIESNPLGDDGIDF